jgi:RNA polymerase sigma-70 factor (ECF subfamily)
MKADPVWEQVLAAARTDESAKGELLEQYRAYLLLLARRALGSEIQTRVDSEDVVQATMLRATRSFSSFSGRSKRQFFRWLMTIHQNSITEEVSWQRAQKRNPSREQPWQTNDKDAVIYWLEPTDDEPTPSVKMMRAEQALKLAQSLMQLPKDQEEAVRLRHLEAWPVEKIAAHMGKSTLATAGLIKRGLARLRREMADQI